MEGFILAPRARAVGVRMGDGGSAIVFNIGFSFMVTDLFNLVSSIVVFGIEPWSSSIVDSLWLVAWTRSSSVVTIFVSLVNLYVASRPDSGLMSSIVVFGTQLWSSSIVDGFWLVVRTRSSSVVTILINLVNLSVASIVVLVLRLMWTD